MEQSRNIYYENYLTYLNSTYLNLTYLNLTQDLGKNILILNNFINAIIVGDNMITTLLGFTDNDVLIVDPDIPLKKN